MAFPELAWLTPSLSGGPAAGVFGWDTVPLCRLGVRAVTVESSAFQCVPNTCGDGKGICGYFGFERASQVS